jgi:histidinol-phosphatase (PHP family)
VKLDCNTSSAYLELIGAIAKISFAPIFNHSTYSDGKSPPEEIVLSAIDKGLEVIGISDHAPIGFKDVHWSIRPERIDDYLSELHYLKEKYRDKINLQIGLEVDYYLGCDDHIHSLHLSRFDYTIGSIHFSVSKSPGITMESLFSH